MREHYSFRFLPEEVTEMRRIFEDHSYCRPPQHDIEELAVSFSKIRNEQGMRSMRVQSIRSWFKRQRSRYINSRTGWPSAMLATSRSPAAQPISLANVKHPAENEASERSCSGDEMSESMESEQGRSEPNTKSHEMTNSVDCAGATLQPASPPQGPVTEADGCVGNSKVLSEASPKSILRKIGQAKATMEKLKELSMVDYRKCEEDIKLAVKVLLEEGDELLSETEKAELPLLPENLHKIAQENDQVRKEMADCGAFLEKVVECEEKTVKLMEKARILEEKYKAFPQSMSSSSNKVSDLETSLHHAKAEVEKMKGDKEDVIAQLVRIAECLQSASTHHKILKEEEASVVQKRNKLMESLRKNSEEWIKLTNSKTYTSFM